MSANNDKRRWKRVIVSQNLLAELFYGPGQCVALRLDPARLPADSKVLFVREDYSRRALVAIVESASFEEVDDGCEIPLFEDGQLVSYKMAHVVGDRIVDPPYAADPEPFPVSAIELSPADESAGDWFRRVMSE